MHELVLLAPEALVEAIGDALIDDCGALAVSVADADDGAPDERALYGEPGMAPARAGWRRSRVSAHFAGGGAHGDGDGDGDGDGAAVAAAARLKAVHGDAVEVVAIAPLPDDDWVRRTQAQFAPVDVAPGFWIVPSWHDVPAGAERVVRLDPGLAFGTGTHPTTRMCLRWIAAQAPARAARWTRVLDYGCGSGILAIGAALHGAGRPGGIDAVDIDPAAVEATRANAAANGVALRAGAPHAAVGAYPLVLANILATPLKLLAPLLAGHVAPGGHLVLAGILERQADELAAAYAPHGVALHATDRDDGWVLMVGARTAEDRPGDAAGRAGWAR